MHAWLVLLGGPILFAIGAWTIAHPDDGYRASGGVGSSLTPASRRSAGYVLTAMGSGLFLIGLVGTLAGE